MEMSDPSGFITEGHRLVERGAALATAASAVPEPDLGFDASGVARGLSSLADASWALAHRLTDTGDDLVFTARSFMAFDGHVGDLFGQLLLGGRFA